MKLKELYNLSKKRLKDGGIEDYEFESICLIQENLKLEKKDVIINPDKIIDDIEAGRLLSDVNVRISGKPLQYILGKWEFFGLPFYVGTGVLIPRADTEICVSEAISFIKENDFHKIIDLCSGSGAIAIAIASVFNNISIDALELGSMAFDYLVKNLKLNQIKNVNTINGDIFKLFDKYEDESIDLIVSNPPYIKSSEINDLQLEVKHEPKMALDGGEDGLYFYKNIIRLWTSKIKPDGVIIFEIGETQAVDVKKLLLNNYYDIRVKNDLSNLNRVVTAKKKSR